MKLSAAEILNITEPGELFQDELSSIKEEYSQLARIWHPDFNRNSRESNKIMAKINTLYEQALELINVGVWKAPGFIKFRSKDGTTYEITYYSAIPFELGTTYVCDKVVVYLIKNEFRDFYQNAEQKIKGFTYANDKMRAEMSMYLPKIISKFETMENSLAMVVEKEQNLLLLKDVLAFYNGKLPDRHVAWVLSTLYNLVCYLQYSRLSHNAISIDTYFISPKNHSGSLLGGWWYSVPEEKKMIGVPEKIYSIMPPQVKDKKLGSIHTDLESVRLLARELLGDRNGTRLEDLGVPRAMSMLLKGTTLGTAYEEYKQWDKVLKESYGVKRFIKMDLTAKTMYSKINK